ncbi:MAG: hypothetical protein LIP28_01545 [Deltaproteobacteria bacterium]|nr:hypothetical protein [Deltaproteobacteria bacterium]
MSTLPHNLSGIPQNLDLPALAASLQAALDAIQPFVPADRQPTPIGEPVQESSREDEAGQTRIYRVSPNALKDESEYLKQYQSEDSFNLMMQVIDRLSVTITLMEQIDMAQDLPEYFLQTLGGHIRESLDTLERIASFLSEMELVYTRTVG